MTAQFISRDPLAVLTRSPYGYVGGNPLNATDPSGKQAIAACAAVEVPVVGWGACGLGAAATIGGFLFALGNSGDESQAALIPTSPAISNEFCSGFSHVNDALGRVLNARRKAMTDAAFEAYLRALGTIATPENPLPSGSGGSFNCDPQCKKIFFGLLLLGTGAIATGIPLSEGDTAPPDVGHP